MHAARGQKRAKNALKAPRIAHFWRAEGGRGGRAGMRPSRGDKNVKNMRKKRVWRRDGARPLVGTWEWGECTPRVGKMRGKCIKNGSGHVARGSKMARDVQKHVKKRQRVAAFVGGSVARGENRGERGWRAWG